MRAYDDLGATIDPPGVVLSPPALRWESMCATPTEATFIVSIVVGVDARATEKLLKLIPTVQEAIDAVPDAAVRSAMPGPWPNGNLPSYQLTVEAGL